MGVNLKAVDFGGDAVDVLAAKDGAILSQEWVMAQILKGRGFCAQAGLLSTPITWTATATNDQTKPAMFLDVPDGTTVIPLEVRLYMEAYGTDALFECQFLTGTGGVSAGGTAMTITNLRTDAPIKSLCTATSDITGGTACTANISAFYQAGVQLVTTIATSDDASMRTPDEWVWNYKTAGYTSPIKGHGQLMAVQGSQAGTGFGKIIFLEIPTAELYL